MNIHLIATGGSVMHNLAIALHRRGHRVSGSDDAIFEPSKSRLAAEGLLPPAEGWDPDRVHSGLDAVILGMHARADNPELLRAQELGLPIYSFPEYIYREAADKRRVAICGSHGKTSITAMILHALGKAGREVDYLVGAQLKGYEVMVKLSEAPLILLEGDEYLASPLHPEPKFLYYKPQIALVSGIAWDHVNVFPTRESYLDAFRALFDGLGDGDMLIANAEDALLERLIAEKPRRFSIVHYATPSYTSSPESSVLKVGEKLFPVKVFGAHNMLNLEGARSVCEALGMESDMFYSAMADFEGAARRLERLPGTGAEPVFRDFAHAPSKVRATVAAVRERYPGRHLTACLELHTFSSLSRQFLPEFSGAMDAADTAIVCYDPAVVRAKRLEPFDPQAVPEAFNRDDLLVCTDAANLRKLLLQRPKEGGVLLLMSSGPFLGLDLTEIASFGDPETAPRS